MPINLIDGTDSCVYWTGISLLFGRDWFLWWTEVHCCVAPALTVHPHGVNNEVVQEIILCGRCWRYTYKYVSPTCTHSYIEVFSTSLMYSCTCVHGFINIITYLTTIYAYKKWNSLHQIRIYSWWNGNCRRK